jgi:hypothetical protein
MRTIVSAAEYTKGPSFLLAQHLQLLFVAYSQIPFPDNPV